MTPISQLQIRSRQIIQYTSFEGTRPPRSIESLIKAKEHLSTQETYSGRMTGGAKKRLTRAIELFAQIVDDEGKKYAISPRTGKQFDYQFVFLTLTVYNYGQQVEGTQASKTLLKPFLQWLDRVKKCKLYIWRAELQMNREDCHQLHYHFVFNKFVDKDEIRDKWNELQRRAGYLDSFYEKFGRWNAPSTQVEKVRNCSDIAGYIWKGFYETTFKNAKIINELSKDQQNKESVRGKVWDCSMNLKSASYFTTQATDEYCARLSYMVKQKLVKPIYTDHCVIWQFNPNTCTGRMILNNNDRELYNIELREISRNDYADVVRSLKPEKRKKIVEEFAPTERKIVKFMPIPDLFSTS